MFLLLICKHSLYVLNTSPLPDIRGLSVKSPAVVNITRTVCVTPMSPGSQGEWLGCAHVNNDDFTVLVSGGGRHY